MAGPLLRVLIRLKSNKYHRMQIAARHRIIDLIQQIAHDLHLKIDQLLHISIYRNGPNGCLLFYPLNNTHYDVLDKYGLSSDEEIYIDLTELIPYEEEDDDENLSSNKHLRNIVATKIESDQNTYSEAILGRTNSDYCKWIRRDDSWGGGIELAILTKIYEIEICVINTESGGRIDYFGEDRNFPYRVFLLYNNLHYDPVYSVTYDIVEQKELLQTKFHRSNENILSLAKDLVNIEQSTK